MTMTSKICNECGKEVDESVNFCPNCKSQSFRPKGEVVVADNSLTHRLFYWRYNDQYMLSKTKVFSLFILVVFGVTSFTSPFIGGSILVTVIVTLIAFLFCYLLHMFLSRPSRAQLENSDYGLAGDLKNMLFYWQDRKTGYFRLSKTKLITWLIFILFFALSMNFSANLVVSVIIGAIFAIPAFIIGFAVHKLTNDDPGVKKVKKAPKPKKVKKQKEVKKPEEEKITTPPKQEIDERLLNYKSEIESLQVKFDAKQKVTRELIEKRFAPPQLTYTRFITSVDKASDLFKKQSNSALNIIELASEDSPRIDREIEAKIAILKTIISKIDDLTNELVLSIDDSKEDDVDSLIEDMDDLIDSVDDYK